MRTELFSKEIRFLDGAMGTMLQQSGLRLGERPELLCLTHPEKIEAVHRAYIESGSEILYTNTFGANRHKLGDTADVAAVVAAATAAARRACAGRDDLFVALDIGPIGELLAPSGTLSFEDAYDLFREQMAAGEQAGADLIVIETMTDLYEVKAAILAAKENTTLPVFVTMTFEENGRTFTGCSVEAFAVVAQGLGADAIGINCSLGPYEILPVAARLAKATDLPLIIKANAGLPDPQTGEYDIGAETFASAMQAYQELGIRFVGGCCGTSPDYIRALVKTYGGYRAPARAMERRSIVCTPSNVVEIDRVRVIGERINPTGKKRFKQALVENDLDYILSQGIAQADAGADILDVNVGLPEIDEVDMMQKVVRRLQSAIDLPLQIDSSNPKAIEAGLRAYNGKAIVNSVNGDQKSLDAILPLVKKYGAAVVGLALDERGIPQNAQERFAIAKRILEAALSYGIPKEDVYIDCLTLTVSAQQEQVKETLRAVQMIKEQLGLKTVLGVSNVSFGLPNRELINATFLAMALQSGLDLPIINPNAQAMMDTVAAHAVLSAADVESGAYIARFANKDDGTPAPVAQNSEITISYAIEKGLEEDAGRIAKTLLQQHEELFLINELLIPALDRVGDCFEKGEIFLPQLLSSAGAACKAFDVVKASITAKGSESISKGTIIVATVQGDIHDIGKNIVKVILENYGYRVIDLGRDVSPQTVVEAAQKENVRLIGLSALMTTTLPSMGRTIDALRNSGHDCKIMVGGAVLTPEYAAGIGADYYVKDAKASVDVAKAVLG